MAIRAGCSWIPRLSEQSEDLKCFDRIKCGTFYVLFFLKARRPKQALKTSKIKRYWARIAALNMMP